MTNYIRVSDGQYPLSEKQIRILFPNTSFPKPFAKPGFEVVFPVPKPECTSLERVVEGAPNLTELETWEQTWSVVDKFSDYTDDEDVFHTKAEQDAAFLVTELADAKLAKETANKKACTDFIISYYPEPKQRSAALGVYASEVVTAMADHITLIIAEENRVYALLEAATTIAELDLVEEPTWPELV